MGSISFLFLVFGILVFLKLQTVLIGNIDAELLNGGLSLAHDLPEYRLKDKNRPQSLYTMDLEGELLFSDDLEQEVKEIFSVNVAFVQLITCPENSGDSPQIVAGTVNLKTPLPFPEKPGEKIGSDSPHIQTITDIFPFSIRMINIRAYDYHKNPYILQIAISMKEMNQVLQNLLLFICFLFPLLLILLSIVGFFFMKKVFSPIKQIVDLTNRITAKDLSKRLDMADNSDEIGELAQTLNHMIERLEQSFARIRQFSEDVAHELKTPLAKLKCNAEISLRKDRTTAEYQNDISAIIKDIKTLEQITNDLLFLSRMDSRKIPRSFEKFCLHELVLSVFEETHQSAHEKKLIVDFGRIDPVDIYADQGLIKTMVDNLISNAVKYTRPGGIIRIDLQKQNKDAELTITDTGVGIPEADLPLIFDRFFRVDPSRSLETGGSGLGLAIVQKIILFHDGRISVKSSPGKGSSFFIRLPRVK